MYIVASSVTLSPTDSFDSTSSLVSIGIDLDSIRRDSDRVCGLFRQKITEIDRKIRDCLDRGELPSLEEIRVDEATYEELRRVYSRLDDRRRVMALSLDSPQHSGRRSVCSSDSSQSSIDSLDLAIKSPAVYESLAEIEVELGRVEITLSGLLKIIFLSRTILKDSEGVSPSYSPQTIQFYRDSINDLLRGSGCIGRGTSGQVFRIESDKGSYALKQRLTPEKSRASLPFGEKSRFRPIMIYPEDESSLRLSLVVPSPYLVSCVGFQGDDLVLDLYDRSLTKAIANMNIDEAIASMSDSKKPQVDSEGAREIQE